MTAHQFRYHSIRERYGEAYATAARWIADKIEDNEPITLKALDHDEGIAPRTMQRVLHRRGTTWRQLIRKVEADVSSRR